MFADQMYLVLISTDYTQIIKIDEDKDLTQLANNPKQYYVYSREFADLRYLGLFKSVRHKDQLPVDLIINADILKGVEYRIFSRCNYVWIVGR